MADQHYSIARHGWVLLLLATVARAGQVVHDGTVGPAGALTGPNYVIPDTAGTTRGNNLFQSFSQFNLDNGESATFTGPATIKNIITRVTGGSASTIDGTIDTMAMPNANFFFINPFGVIFGPNAVLNVGGAVAITTADYIKLADGGRFDARNPANDILTTAPVSAFGFLGPAAGSIRILGGDANAGDPPVTWQVSAGQSLSLVGGDIEIANGSLSAPGGRINLVSVQSAGEVNLDVANISGALDLSRFATLGSVRISGGSFLDVSADSRGGRLEVQAQTLDMRDSVLAAEDYGAEDGFGMNFALRTSMQLNASYISAANTGDGLGGEIRVSTPTLILANGSTLISGSSGAGDSGDIHIRAESLQLDNGFIQASASSDAHGGAIDILTSSFKMSAGSFISTTTFAGPSGNLTIQAHTIQLDASGIESQAHGASAGGKIEITADSLSLANGADISTSTFGPGAGGNVEITASLVQLDGANTIIASKSADFASGSGGSIVIAANKLNLVNGAQITTSTEQGTTGTGGSIHITADTVSLDSAASMQSASLGDGSAGGVAIDCQQLRLQGSALISVSADHSTGGDITVNAGNSIRLINGQISAQAFLDGGNVRLTTPSLVYLLNSQIFAQSDNGNGGNITIDPQLVVLNNSLIKTSAIMGNGGNINVDSGYFLSSHSVVDASSEFGLQGTVAITSPNADLAGDFVDLAAQPLDAESRLRPHCAVRLPHGVSSFTTAGRGGMPIEPDGLLPALPAAK